MQLFWIAAALLAAGALGALFATVDDWRRDLVTNHAATDAQSPDPELRPLEAPCSLETAERAVRQAAKRLPRWALADSEAEAPADGRRVLRLVRSTRLWRFKDDVVVTLSGTESGTRFEVSSRSRIGRGDLGQNPRNIKELLREVRSELAGDLQTTSQGRQ